MHTIKMLGIDINSKSLIIPDCVWGTLSVSVKVSSFSDTEPLSVSMDTKFFCIGAHPMTDLSGSCGLIKTTDSVTYEYN